MTIAVKTFLRYNDKYKAKPTEKIPQGKISLHLDEQKLPPMGDDLVRKSATVVPLTTSEWDTAMQNEDASNEEDPDALKLRWDGKWKPNPDVTGNWNVVANVNDPAEFDPAKNKSARSPFISSLGILDKGQTDDDLILWTGDHLLDLKRYEALRMVRRKVADADYLFVEGGSFNGKKKPRWESRWLVFKPAK